MKDHSVNSYDLKQAREILSSLVSGTTAVREEKKPESPLYLRLSDDSTARGEARHAPEPAPETAPAGIPDVPPQQFPGWESCISWCMNITRSEAAFVVDSQGFVIASRGRVPGHGFDGTGAELICSVEQLERIDPDAGRLVWIDLDYDKRRVVGFIPPSGKKEYYVLGLISPEPSYVSLKQIITRQIMDNLPNLD